MLDGSGPDGLTQTRERAAFAAPVAASLAVTTVANLSPLLVSGLAVQIQDDLDFGETELGLIVGSFFVVGALGSAVSGRMVERIGAAGALRYASVLSGAALLLASLAESWLVLVAFVALAGVANAGAQPAANLYTARAIDPRRQGIAIGIQKSGVPGAALLGGLAVPTVGLTIGWEWAFVIGGVIAVAASLGVPSVGAARAPSVSRTGADRRERPRPDVPIRVLLILAVATGLAAASSGALVSFFVLSAVEIGIDEGPAGLLLVIGSAIGIVARLVLGAHADRSDTSAWHTLSLLFVIAAGAFAAMAVGSKGLLLASIPFSFGTAFAWTGIYHLAVIRSNPSAPGAATGITMTGSFTGAVTGPLIFGLLADHLSYGWAWSFVVGVSAGAATMMYIVGRVLPAPAPDRVPDRTRSGEQ